MKTQLIKCSFLQSRALTSSFRPLKSIVLLTYLGKGNGMVHLYSATIAASAVLSSQTYNLGRSWSPQSWTLACSQTATSAALVCCFNGLCGTLLLIYEVLFCREFDTAWGDAACVRHCQALSWSLPASHLHMAATGRGQPIVW